VGNNKQRSASLLHLPQPCDALSLEFGIPHCKDFIDDQNIGVNMHGYRETQPQVHAG
jgi:phage replication-related protein YjqB (UPF0714/DUF867 family)